VETDLVNDEKRGGERSNKNEKRGGGKNLQNTK
jgi:hypothetical protein